MITSTTATLYTPKLDEVSK